jgi:putative membrane-bound dehydrogenase-like protein
MKRRTLSVTVLSLALVWMIPAGEPAAEVHQVKLNGHVFTLPAGFEIELVAGPPLVNRPITADFDERGRLYVADSSGSNENVDDQLKTKPHRIVRLEDSDGDGTFDRATVFADRMMFPEGTMWLAGSLYVAAPPVIWKLTDTDGDGVADRREEWFNGKTLTRCANDLHGPYRGPDGLIYWCKGAFANQAYERPGKGPLVTRAAHIFRARPDGTGIEPVMTGGMDNPVDLVFTSGGERIFTTTFLQFPGGGRRDGLIHDVYGGIYGKDWEVIHDSAHKWTGPTVMPVLAHLGPAAPAGLTRYESREFGAEYQDNLFATLFNLQKVTRHVLEPDGGTFKTRDSDFLVSSNKDFHPTDVLEDADGSLVVLDTGGWYKLCCPTSQLVKPDVLGAIYRIRKKGAARPEDPRGLKLAWGKMGPSELAGLLGDARPAVRRRAIETLAGHGASAVAALEPVLKGPDDEARRSAVWCATRINHPAARALVRMAFADSSDTVRQTALHSVSVWRDREAVPELLAVLKGKSAQNRRAAAEALGRIGDHTAVPALLAAAAGPADRFVEHSLTYALIEIADAGATAAGLKATDPRTRRAALVALDQMENGGLTADALMPNLAAADAPLKEAAWWAASRHPEWGKELSTALRQRLAAMDLAQPEREEFVRQLAALARSAAIQQLLSDALTDPSASADARRLALQAMARAGLKQAPPTWLAGLTQTLSSNNPDILHEAVAVARTLRQPKQSPPELAAALLKVGGNVKLPAEVRTGALAAVPGGLGKVDPAVFDFLRGQLKTDEPVLTRSAAAEALAHAKLSAEQLLLLCESIKAAGPMEVTRLLEVFGQSSDEKVGRGLVEGLKDSPGRAGLRAETLKPLLAKYGPGVEKLGAGLIASLEGDAVAQKARLEAMVAKLPSGDVRRGQAVFNSPKAACASCHAIGYLGGKVGPDLTRIGSIRTERDLLESIVFPSASFVRGYEPVLVVTRDGKSFTGLLHKDEPDEVVLVTGANQEAHIPREEIEEMLPSRTSVMPAGLDQQLTAQELADLVAFLKACR